MAEYIDREALLQDIEAAINNNGMGYVVGKTMIRYLKRQPAADVEEVKHGWWVNAGGRQRVFYECSLCKDRWHYGAMLHMKYCPNCKAKMDGGKDG